MSKSNGKCGLALFGMGRAGQIHFKNLLSHYKINLLYVVEMDTVKAREIMDEYNCDATLLTPKEQDKVFHDKRVRGILIATSTFTHDALIHQAFENGKAVFCEKPLSQTFEGTKACYQAAKAANLPLLCSFNRRFDPSLQTMQSRVRSGELGEIHTVKSSARDHPFPPLEFLKHSGGMFHDTGVHDIDLITWLINEYPESVFSFAHCHNEALKSYGDVDTAVIVMRFPSGVLATIDYSRNSPYGYDQRCEVFGTKGMLVNENQRPTELVCHNKDGSFHEPMKYSFPQRYNDSYKEAMNNFLAVIEGSAQPQVTGEQTLRVSLIATACEESHKTGMPVKVDYSSIG